GDPPWGYGWVFPKARHLSVGVGTLRPGNARLPERFQAFLAALGLEGNPKKVSGHPIPLPSSGRLSVPRVLLAGDAAGLADPLSGEGIAHAIRSGKLAAEAAIGALGTGDFRFLDYNGAIHSHILIELRAAERVARVFHRMPRLFFTLLERSPDTLSHYFKIVQGKATYRQLGRRIHRGLIRLGAAAGTPPAGTPPLH